MAGEGAERPDEELVRRYLAGDRAAFAALVMRHERRVYNLAFRLLGREEDARDATQDAFLNALRKLSTFRGEARFTTWMHRVTVNTCYDLLRRRRREPQPETVRGEDDRPQEPAAPWPDPAEATATSVDVQRALLQVPPEFRAVLVLHDIHDLSYEDIAEVLGIPEGTAKSRLHRARVALARAMAGERAEAEAPSEGTIP